MRCSPLQVKSSQLRGSCDHSIFRLHLQCETEEARRRVLKRVERDLVRVRRRGRRRVVRHRRTLHAVSWCIGRGGGRGHTTERGGRRGREGHTSDLGRVAR